MTTFLPSGLGVSSGSFTVWSQYIDFDQPSFIMLSKDKTSGHLTLYLSEYVVVFLYIYPYMYFSLSKRPILVWALNQECVITEVIMSHLPIESNDGSDPIILWYFWIPSSSRNSVGSSLGWSISCTGDLFFVGSLSALKSYPYAVISFSIYFPGFIISWSSLSHSNPQPTWNDIGPNPFNLKFYGLLCSILREGSGSFVTRHRLST